MSKQSLYNVLLVVNGGEKNNEAPPHKTFGRKQNKIN